MRRDWLVLLASADAAWCGVCWQTLRQYKEKQTDTDVLIAALTSMQDKTCHLETSLSAETRLKLDLFSALGDAKRQIEITQGERLDEVTGSVRSIRVRLDEVTGSGVCVITKAVNVVGAYSSYFVLLRLRLTSSYFVLLRLTSSYFVLLRLTSSYSVLLRLTPSYSVLLRLTPSYSVLLRLTPSYFVLLRLRLTSSSLNCVFVLLRLRWTASSSYFVFVLLRLRLTSSSSYCVLLHLTLSSSYFVFVELRLRLTSSSLHCIFVAGLVLHKNLEIDELKVKIAEVLALVPTTCVNFTSSISTNCPPHFSSNFTAPRVEESHDVATLSSLNPNASDYLPKLTQWTPLTTWSWPSERPAIPADTTPPKSYDVAVGLWSSQPLRDRCCLKRNTTDCLPILTWPRYHRLPANSDLTQIPRTVCQSWPDPDTTDCLLILTWPWYHRLFANSDLTQIPRTVCQSWPDPDTTDCLLILTWPWYHRLFANSDLTQIPPTAC